MRGSGRSVPLELAVLRSKTVSGAPEARKLRRYDLTAGPPGPSLSALKVLTR